MKGKFLIILASLLFAALLLAACPPATDEGQIDTGNSKLPISDTNEVPENEPDDLNEPDDIEYLDETDDIDESLLKQEPLELEMVWIQPGSFIMGSSIAEWNDRGFYIEYPDPNTIEFRHKVTLTKGFYMGKYPVTQKQWTEVMGYNPSYYQVNNVPANYWRWWENSPQINIDDWCLESDNRPVERVTWYEAVEFCNKLSILEGLEPVYIISNKTWRQSYGGFWHWDVTMIDGANGYRLPTEAEWEYACRAGTTTAWNTGTEITSSQANYNYSGISNDLLPSDRKEGPFLTTKVGSFKPNAWGLYDMHGNVDEWCWDIQGVYTAKAWDLGAETVVVTDLGDDSLEERVDPTGPYNTHSNIAIDYYRVIRGGSFNSFSTWALRSASRGGSMGGTARPSDISPWFGFRVVRSE